MRLAQIALLLAATGCAASSAARRESSVPVTASRQPLHITIVYPDTAEPIQAQDSSFIFGSVGAGRGDVALTINGVAVPVSARGTWLAWLPLPAILGVRSSWSRAAATHARTSLRPWRRLQSIARLGTRRFEQS
jgi:hypothetical protein